MQGTKAFSASPGSVKLGSKQKREAIPNPLQRGPRKSILVIKGSEETPLISKSFCHMNVHLKSRDYGRRETVRHRMGGSCVPCTPLLSLHSSVVLFRNPWGQDDTLGDSGPGKP